MVFFVLAALLSWLIDLGTLRFQSDRDKELEILLLRRQLAILQRAQARPVRPCRWEQLGLAVLAGKLRHLPDAARSRVQGSLRLFSLQTVLRWHRELVRRKWTFRPRRAPGRPPITPELEALILRLARENPAWGYRRIAGELGKLGYRVGRSTISAALRRHRIPPTPTRDRGASWRSWYRHYRREILACDFFQVESLFWRRSSCCSSSRCARGGSISPAAPGTRPPPGSPSRGATWPGTSRRGRCPSPSSCTTATADSRLRSTRSSGARGWRWPAPRRAAPGRKGWLHTAPHSITAAAIG